MTRMKLNLTHRPGPLRTLWRYRCCFALPAASAFTLVMVSSLFMPRAYEATARFRHTGDAGVTPTRQAVKHEVADRAALETMIDDGSLIESLAGRVAVSAEAEDVVSVTVRDTDPRRAADVANRLVERYLAKARQSLATQFTETDAFLAQQIEARQDELAMLRLSKSALEQDNPLLADAGDDARDARLAAQSQLRNVEQQLAALEQEHATLTRLVAEQPDYLEQRTRGRNPEVAHLNNQKAQLEQELNEHRYKWGRTDEHPLVQKTQAKIAALDAKLAETPAVIDLAAQRQDNSAKLESRAKLESLAVLLRTLTARRDALREDAARLASPDHVDFRGRAEHAEVVRKIAAAQQDLDFWHDKRRDLALAQTAGTIGPTWLDRAAPPRRPSFPPTGAITLASLLAAALAGFVTTFATRATGRVFDSVEVVRRELGMPVLGAVAEISGESRPRAWRRAA